MTTQHLHRTSFSFNSSSNFTSNKCININFNGSKWNNPNNSYRLNIRTYSFTSSNNNSYKKGNTSSCSRSSSNCSCNSRHSNNSSLNRCTLRYQCKCRWYLSSTNRTTCNQSKWGQRSQPKNDPLSKHKYTLPVAAIVTQSFVRSLHKWEDAKVDGCKVGLYWMTGR